MSSNAEQIEFWNGPAAERWVKFQAQLDRGMQAITGALIDFTAPRKDEFVLDVGCGCGETVAKLVQAVGSPEHVTGVDVSKPMLTVARQTVPAAHFIEADASTYTFTQKFDLVFSRFGVMFFADPLEGLANLRKSLKANGRISFVCWRALAQNVWATLPMEAARPFIAAPPPADPNAPGPFAFADQERLFGLLSKAGFDHVRVEKLDTAMWMGTDVREASTQALSIGPLARALIDASEATRGKVRAAVANRLADFTAGSGVVLPAACWLVGAKA